MEKWFNRAVFTLGIGLLTILGAAALFAQEQQQTPPGYIQHYTEPLAPPNVNMAGASLAVVSTQSNSVNLPADPNAYPTLYLYNAGSVALFFNLGGTSVAAATTNVPLVGGSTMCLATGGNTYIAAITGSSTATLYIVQSQGCPSR